MTQIDARGLPCPQPVILTRNAMRQGETSVRILVSTEIQVANVKRLAEKADWTVTVTETADGHQLDLVGPQAVPGETVTPATDTPAAASGPTVVVFASDKMGDGPDELGAVLARAFFHTLTELDQLPETIVLYSSGVKLATLDSPILPDLEELAERGTEILVCGTCTGFLEISEQIGVGDISNMYTIAETLLGAGLVVKP